MQPRHHRRSPVRPPIHIDVLTTVPSLYPDCRGMPARDRGSAAGSDELHQRAGPVVGGEAEIRVGIVAGQMDMGGQTRTRVGQRERAARARNILDEIVCRCGRGGKVRRVDRVAGPETGDRSGEILRLLEREPVRAGLVDGLPGRNARVELKIGVGEAEGPRSADRSGEFLGFWEVGRTRPEAIEIEPLLVSVPDTLRAATSEALAPAPLPVRSTVPLLTKEFAVTEPCWISSVRVLVSAPDTLRVPSLIEMEPLLVSAPDTLRVP